MNGSARTGELLRQSSRRELDRAVREQSVERVGRGRYALPALPPGLKTARSLAGVLSHESAAAFWLLQSLGNPTKVHVTVPERAHRTSRRGVTLHYAGQRTEDEVTSPIRTVLDCARTMPFREGLAIADSSLRIGLVIKEELMSAAAELTNRGRRLAREVARHSTPLAANPFESALRAAAIQAGLLGFRPQLVVEEDLAYRVDLADVRLRVAAEADSFEWHGSRAALDRDCKRYDELISRGWLVLRFSWEQVMFEPEWVARMLLDTCAQRQPYRRGGFTGPKGRIRR